MFKGKLYILILLLLVFTATPLYAESSERFSDSQKVYVPAYSHIYFGNKERPLLLSITLSIRNVDPNRQITVSSVKYYKTEGALVREILDKPLDLQPLGSVRYVIAQDDNTGGSGANFIVEWKSKNQVNPPIIETVMIGTQNQLGISFTSRGMPIYDSSGSKQP